MKNKCIISVGVSLFISLLAGCSLSSNATATATQTVTATQTATKVVTTTQTFSTGTITMPTTSPSSQDFSSSSSSTTKNTATKTEVPFHQAYLSNLQPKYETVGYGSLYKDQADSSGSKLSLKGLDGEIQYEHGFFAHAYSTLVFDGFYNYNVTSFSVAIGCNVTSRNSGVTSMKFFIYFDQELAYESETIKGNSTLELVELDCHRINSITLVIDDLGGNGNDHGVWADPIITYQSENILEEVNE